MFMKDGGYFTICWNSFINSKRGVYKVNQFTVVLLPCYRKTDGFGWVVKQTQVNTYRKSKEIPPFFELSLSQISPSSLPDLFPVFLL